MALEYFKAKPSMDVPDTKRLIVTSAHKYVPIWVEGHTPVPISMASQGLQANSCAYIPYAYGAIFTTTCHDISIRAESHPSDPIGMAMECFETVAGSSIPQAHSLVFTTTCQDVSIRVEGTHLTPCAGFRNVLRQSPVFPSQRRIFWSSLLLTRVWP